ncbi:MAG: uncharacterized protein KVP18_000151 [Porospora cf. gigantea A]|uniref:uncharacterized protein n=1 Tax=Porospora cf. gigantea A TaxID=2853593 RepID=UPI00355A665A|nr:MAG: hypothetical protein KVP18_000151 [Porospora cf. gigantea A]
MSSSSSSGSSQFTTPEASLIDSASELESKAIEVPEKKWMKYVKLGLKWAVVLAWFAWLIAATVISANHDIMDTQWPALAMTGIGLIYYLCHKFKRQIIRACWDTWGPATRILVNRYKNPWGYVVGSSLLLLFIILWIALMVDDYIQVTSLLGLAFFVLTGWLFSKHPKIVSWRAVLWGLIIQMSLAVIILRVDFGYHAMKYLSDHVAIFLGYIQAGSSFVFGGPSVVASFGPGPVYCPTVAEMSAGMSQPALCAQAADGTVLYGVSILAGPWESTPAHLVMYFATVVIPTVIFFSSFMSALYYIGIIQKIIKGIAFLLKHSMGTSTGESVNAAANIFVGQTEAPLVIKPFLHLMSASEIHAVMTGGFATIAGGVMASYIGLGVSPGHLISASVISAPAALAVSKLYYPETEVTSGDDPEALDNALYSSQRNYHSVLEAMSAGAADAVPLALNIGAMLIAFLSILEFVNGFVDWMAVCVNWRACQLTELDCTVEDQKITFQYLMGYLLCPVAWMMGVVWKDCRAVASLIGMKTILNEFVAYETLSGFIAARDSCLKSIEAGGPDDCLATVLDERSIVVATYALCGFANLGSIGIQLGGLTPLCPEKKSVFASVVVRALIAGTVAALMTATIASFLYQQGRTFK